MSSNTFVIYAYDFLFTCIVLSVFSSFVSFKQSLWSSPLWELRVLRKRRCAFHFDEYFVGSILWITDYLHTIWQCKQFLWGHPWCFPCIFQGWSRRLVHFASKSLKMLGFATFSWCRQWFNLGLATTRELVMSHWYVQYIWVAAFFNFRPPLSLEFVFPKDVEPELCGFQAMSWYVDAWKVLVSNLLPQLIHMISSCSCSCMISLSIYCKVHACW